MTDRDAAQERKLVCRCREVTEQEVLTAIEDGARSVRGVKLRTLATTGLCQGHTCSPLIESILRRELGAGYIPDDRPARAPVRPIPVGLLAPKTEGPRSPKADKR
jgi:NAD(P)H-nitrite reductase large subunit